MNVVCPTPIGAYQTVVMGHGAGGLLSHQLFEKVFRPAFSNPVLDRVEDQATLPELKGRPVLTTDGFVVKPLFFPGGDIGALCIHGTINDLAVGGAIPRAITASFILEEGLPFSDLERIVASMARAAREAGVAIVAGDTKVVERGRGDQIFISTTGLGELPPGRALSINSACAGDRILVSGTLGDHGVAILSTRDGLQFETAVQSDSAALHTLTASMLEVCPQIRCMRDLTRGGLSSALHELATASKVGATLDERSIPVKPEVRGACELLGLDPLYVANEGKLMAIVPAEHAAALLSAMRAHPQGIDAADVGEVVAAHPGTVTLRSAVGGLRTVTMLAGEQLPRIC